MKNQLLRLLWVPTVYLLATTLSPNTFADDVVLSFEPETISVETLKAVDRSTASKKLQAKSQATEAVLIEAGSAEVTVER